MHYERVHLDNIIGKHGIKGIHPASNLLPMMTDEQFQSMCTDVEANGFLHPVRVTNDGFLIDGRNRLQVGWAISLDPVIQKFNPPDVIAYVISENINRRHLTAGQLAFVGKGLANLRHGDQANRSDIGIPISQPEAAKQVGTTKQAISQANTIAEWAPEEAKKVESGKLALDAGYKVAKKNKQAAAKKETPEKSHPKDGTLYLPGIVNKKLIDVPYPEPKRKHQFNKTNDSVDWASWTWNPVTGCLHGCTYCYAREMAYRDSYKASYPIQFSPLFHHERLQDPVNTTPGKGRPQDGRVFVCSMADLFGEWVPQNWIDSVLDATLEAPEWEYLFLTKFPQRYRRINLPPKAWFGASVDIQKRVKITEKTMPELDVAVRWISVEPMLEPITFTNLSWCDLIVIGAQSETNQPDGFVPAVAPKLEWVMDLIAQARSADVPVYLKPNLLGDLTGSKPGMVLPQEQPRRRK